MTQEEQQEKQDLLKRFAWLLEHANALERMTVVEYLEECEYRTRRRLYGPDPDHYLERFYDPNFKIEMTED